MLDWSVLHNPGAIWEHHHASSNSEQKQLLHTNDFSALLITALQSSCPGLIPISLIPKYLKISLFCWAWPAMGAWWSLAFLLNNWPLITHYLYWLTSLYPFSICYTYWFWMSSCHLRFTGCAPFGARGTQKMQATCHRNTPRWGRLAKREGYYAAFHPKLNLIWLFSALC